MIAIIGDYTYVFDSLPEDSSPSSVEKTIRASRDKAIENKKYGSDWNQHPTLIKVLSVLVINNVTGSIIKNRYGKVT